ncbi:MAG: hypothetical protein A2464_13670 [Deltaproteobacteria bacterium RIFOXYC2_FULL_48_10]|nr:MAG: hypothetical protein A2464_13670 [Deltaproteobacteria bacterium RIFOXYC2_FULL_48_10]
MTDASIKALDTIRDISMLKWYVIPLLAIVFYIYTAEMKKARETRNWNAVFAGLTVFGMDFINETWNGWVLHFTVRSAFWTAPGDTALRTLVGWNIEIMFMFAISGIIYYNTISENKTERILGIPNQWFWAIGYSAFCVFVEWFLNKGGHLIWEYPFWNRSFKGVWLIFFFGYFHFYVAALLVINMKTIKAKMTTVISLYTIAVLANIYGLGIMGWRY